MPISSREALNRWTLRICILAAMGLLATVGLVERREALAVAARLFEDERCRFHRPSAGTPIYDERRRLADGSPWTLSFAPWATLLNGRNSFGHPSVLLGQYQTSSDRAFLIGIEISNTAPPETAMPGEPRSISCVAMPRAFGPDGWGSEPAETSTQIWVPAHAALQLLDVQPDPRRPDRFTMRYTGAGCQGLLSGTLADDGTVTIEVESGPAILPTPQHNTPYLIREFDGATDVIQLGTSAPGGGSF